MSNLKKNEGEKWGFQWAGKCNASAQQLWWESINFNSNVRTCVAIHVSYSPAARDTWDSCSITWVSTSVELTWDLVDIFSPTIVSALLVKQSETANTYCMKMRQAWTWKCPVYCLLFDSLKSFHVGIKRQIIELFRGQWMGDWFVDKVTALRKYGYFYIMFWFITLQ